MNRNQFLTVKTAPLITPVTPPGWAEPCHVRSLDGHGRATLLDLFTDLDAEADGIDRIRAAFSSLARAVVLVVCDEAGEPLLSDADLETVAGYRLDVLQAITAAGLLVNGIGDAAKKNSTTD